jgi:biopolymer transport protein ExbD
MRIRRNQEEGSEINITSLVDVMFILIIFFLVTTTYKNLEMDYQVRLPDESEGKPLTQTEPVIVVIVRKSNTYLMMGKPVTIEEIQVLVKDAVRQNPGRKVLIRADQEALHGYVARAVAACRHAGIAEANIGYDWKN